MRVDVWPKIGRTLDCEEKKMKRKINYLNIRINIFLLLIFERKSIEKNINVKLLLSRV